MRRRTAAEEAQFGHLRAAYEGAFRELIVRVNLWQQLAHQALTANAAIGDAHGQADEALAAYRSARNLLADFMLEKWQARASRPIAKAATAAEGAGTTSPGDDRTALKSQVEALAHQLWERAGRPIGNPEADWYRAEQLVLRHRIYCH